MSEYVKVASVDDLPASFSPPIANYAMGLNDAIADDALRQELLLPFVTRLAGSADALEVENRRTALIITRIVTDLLPLALEALGWRHDAERCRSAKTMTKAHQAASELAAQLALARDLADSEALIALTDALAHVTKAMERYIAGDSYHAYGTAAGVTWRLVNALERTFAVDCDKTRVALFRAAASILDDTLKVGKQADPIGAEAALARTEAAKREAAAWRSVMPEAVA